jgi:hypothetical protein
MSVQNAASLIARLDRAFNPRTVAVVPYCHPERSDGSGGVGGTRYSLPRPPMLTERDAGTTRLNCPFYW